MDKTDPFEHIPEEGPPSKSVSKDERKALVRAFNKAERLSSKMASTSPVKNRVKDTLKENEVPVNKPARLKDFTPQGNFTKMADIAGQDVLVWAINDMSTKFGPALTLTCTWPDEEHSAESLFQVVTSGAALVPALNSVRRQAEAGDVKFPLLCSFVKATNAEGQEYWTIE